MEEVQLADSKRFRKISSKKNNKRRNLSKGENCALLSCYTASSGNSLPNVSGQPIGLIFKGEEKFILEDETESLFRNVGKKLPLLSAL